MPALPSTERLELNNPVPAGTHLTGMCTKPGVAGGLALLGALHRSPLACISLKGLAAQGGFQAAYLGVSGVHQGDMFCVRPACSRLHQTAAAGGGVWAAHLGPVARCVQAVHG